MSIKFILASASPARLDILHSIGFPPDKVHPANCDETPRPGELPSLLARRLAYEKAQVVHKLYPGSVILAADTVAARGRSDLPKAVDEDTAIKCLRSISGRRHKLFTAVTIIDSKGNIYSRLARAVITVKQLQPYEIDMMLDSQQWRDKAGGYDIQGLFMRFVRQINGCISTIRGLPAYDVASILQRLLSVPRSGSVLDK